MDSMASPSTIPQQAGAEPFMQEFATDLEALSDVVSAIASVPE